MTESKACIDFIYAHWHINYASDGLIVAPTREWLLTKTVPALVRRFYDQEFGCIVFDKDRLEIVCDHGRKIYCFSADEWRRIHSKVVGHAWYDGAQDPEVFLAAKLRVRCAKAQNHLIFCDDQEVAHCLPPQDVSLSEHDTEARPHGN
jgi:hypothetical protein